MMFLQRTKLGLKKSGKQQNKKSQNQSQRKMRNNHGCISKQ